MGTPYTELTPDLIDRVRNLSPDDKDRLFELAFDEPPVDLTEIQKVWTDEIARRVEDVQSGRVEMLDAEAALDRIEQKLRERRGG